MPLPFYLPTFNLICNRWSNQHNHNPPTGPPDSAFPCNLSLSRRAALQQGAPETWMLMPANTLIVPPVMDALFPNGDIVEVPAGSGRLYNVVFVDDSGKGFANEHRVAKLAQCLPWPEFALGVGGAGSVGLGSGGSNGGEFATFSFNVTIPFTGYIVWIVSMIQTNTGGFEDAHIGPITLGAMVQSNTFGAAGHIQKTYAGVVSAAAGATITVTCVLSLGGHAAWQWEAYATPGHLGAQDIAEGGGGVTAVPTHATVASNAFLPENYFGSFAVVNPAGPSVWNAPYVRVNPDVEDTIAGAVFRLTSGRMRKTAGFTSQAMSLSSPVCDGWTALQASFS